MAGSKTLTVYASAQSVRAAGNNAWSNAANLLGPPDSVPATVALGNSSTSDNLDITANIPDEYDNAIFDGCKLSIEIDTSNGGATQMFTRPVNSSNTLSGTSRTTVISTGTNGAPVETVRLNDHFNSSLAQITTLSQLKGFTLQLLGSAVGEVASVDYFRFVIAYTDAPLAADGTVSATAGVVTSVPVEPGDEVAWANPTNAQGAANSTYASVELDPVTPTFLKSEYLDFAVASSSFDAASGKYIHELRVTLKNVRFEHDGGADLATDYAKVIHASLIDNSDTEFTLDHLPDDIMLATATGNRRDWVFTFRRADNTLPSADTFDNLNNGCKFRFRVEAIAPSASGIITVTVDACEFQLRYLNAPPAPPGSAARRFRRMVNKAALDAANRGEEVDASSITEMLISGGT